MSLPPPFAAPSSVDISYRDYLRDRRRRGWVIAALILSQIAIALEAVTHLCASAFFDPMPDLATGLAYGLVVGTLWFSEKVLAQDGAHPLVRRLGQRRATTLAIAASAVSLLIATMAAYMFLPLTPFAIPLLMMGIGALMLVPLLDTILLLIQLRTLLALWRTSEAAAQSSGDHPVPADRLSARRLGVGTAIIGAVAVFWLIVRPVMIGQATAEGIRSPERSPAQRRAFAALRFLQGERTLLDLAYRRNPPYWVCLGYNAAKDGAWPWNGYRWNSDSDKARRTYFLLTGTPFETVPRPSSLIRQGGLFGGPDDVAIEEQGGYVVGRPVPDLRLAASELKATADPRTETAEYEWMMTFRNDSSEPQEARADILLPHGGVGHAVSLWINGVEQKAKFGSPQKVRAAYQEVVVVQRRDPLLVTMPAPDHLLAQCFPVPANGEMKIKIGITAPLRWDRNDQLQPELVVDWPAFGPVNFDVPRSQKYGIALRTVGEGGTEDSLRGEEELFSPRPTVVTAGHRTSPQGGNSLAPGVVRAADPLAPLTQPVDLVFVLDASAGMDGLLGNGMIGRAMNSVRHSLPKGSRVRFSDTVRFDRSTVWENADGAGAMPYGSPPYTSYTGGTDPAPALAWALRTARRERKNPSAVVFLHAASPANISDLAEVRRQLQSDPDNGPALIGVQLTPRAQDAVMMDLAGFDRVYARRALSGDGDIADAVHLACRAAVSGAVTSATAARQPLGGRTPAIGEVWLDPAAAIAGPNRDTPYARLAQATKTVAGWYASNTLAEPQALDLRIEAGRPAAKAHLVTPLSSAVVLETKEQYQKHGLDDEEEDKDTKKDGKPKNDEVTASPEPGTLLLFAAGLTVAGIGAWRRRGSGSLSRGG